MLKLFDFSCDYVTNPTVVRCQGIRFGWKLESDQKNTLQKNYRITISETGSGKTVADTGTVESAVLCANQIPGLSLSSRGDYTVKVTVTDNHGETASLDYPVHAEILPDDWAGALWIKPAHHITGWAPYLRAGFHAKSPVHSAVLYACGLGVGEWYVNGQRTDEGYIDPPISNYEKIIYCRRLDVTSLICQGENKVAVLLGEGFYSQSRVWGREGMVYGDVCAIARLDITYDDGTSETVVTDKNWKFRYSPITVNNLYGGETYDCRLELPDFADPGADDAGWENVTEDSTPKGTLTVCLMPPVEILGELPAVSMHGVCGNGDGCWIYDIGENIAGIAEFRLPPSPRGAVYVFRYAETLGADGQLDVRSTGSFATQCIQQDIYIARGNAEGETYRPRLCYHGFRYVEVSGIHDFSKGYGTTPQLSIVTGLRLSTAMKKTASFSSSYAPLDRFLSLMEITYRANFHGIPEDCPAREKCGWLGDAQIVSNYGLLNYDSVPAYEKYLQDIRTTTEVYGTWQMIAPGKRGCGEASPLWGCAQIIIPYYLWKYRGDTNAVLSNFDLMEEWVRHECRRADDFIISEGLGDWDPAGGNDSPRRIPVPQSSTFMFWEICARMEEMCRSFAIGDAEYYRNLASQIRESLNRHFYNATEHSYGYWASDGIALELDIAPDGERDALAHSLLSRMEKEDYAMPTGIYGNKYLVPALFEMGHGDAALRMLFSRNHPSFGTMMEHGAASVWEEPDMVIPEDHDQGSVASYNHPMHGGFLYSVITHVAGMQEQEPGYAVLHFAPCFTKTITSFTAEQATPYGIYKVSCHQDGDRAIAELTVPAGASATVNKGVTVDGAPCQGGLIGSGTHTVIFHL